MASNHPLKDTFLTQLRSIHIGSREFPNALTKMLASQEAMNVAMSLQGDDALVLVDVLDQAFEAPNMTLDLRRKSVRILRRVCGTQSILPRSCILSENVTRKGEIAFASGGFADIWKGRSGGSRVCIKAFRTYPAENLAKIKQRLFQEIVIWRRLSHPNVLPVSGVSPELFPVCVITEWMVDGNIAKFTSKHPEVNRLRLLAEAASGLHYLHSMNIIHSDLKPTKVLIDRNFHPRLTDYGLVATISDSNAVDPGSTASPPVGTVRYMAPELLNPRGFGLEDGNPIEKSDVYAFGMVMYQVITGQQLFPGVRQGAIIYNVITGERPARPPGPNEWLSDNVWSFISRCWSPSLEGRPDVNFAINALNDAADIVEARRRKSYATANDQGKSISSRVSDVTPSSREPSRRQPDDTAVQPVPKHPPQVLKPPETPSPFVMKTPAGSRAPKKERKRPQPRQFRVWHDFTNSHREEAALVDYKAEMIYLSSSNGALLEIAEDKLSPEDLNYVHSLDVYKKEKRKKPQRGLDVVRWVVRSPHMPPESRPSTPYSTPPSPPAPTTPATRLELWEADLIVLFNAGKAGVRSGPERKKAQEFANKLDAALDNKDFPEQEMKQHISHLRKLCCMFDILPSSFILTPTFDERGTTPFATGGFSEVYEATLGGRRVAVKVLKANTETINIVHRLLVKEVIGWKWIRHENVLPFVGVSLKPPLFSIISERMENGNIMDFIKVHPDHNRIRLLMGAVTGLEYLHERGIVHGDLKGANILVDSDRRARLADFGLAVITDESAGRTTSNGGEMRGTTRWMAPELMNPEEFGFIGELLRRLPSTSTDIYAIGMTILEVLTGCHPFNDTTKNVTVIWKVMKGDRPDRPPVGFSDTLWELLVATWVVEDGPESKRRPSASVVLDWLKKDVDNWEKSIIPVIPKQWEESLTSFGAGNGREEIDAPDSSQTILAIPLPQVDQDKTIQRGPIPLGVTNKFKEFFRLG